MEAPGKPAGKPAGQGTHRDDPSVSSVCLRLCDLGKSGQIGKQGRQAGKGVVGTDGTGGELQQATCQRASKQAQASDLPVHPALPSSTSSNKQSKASHPHPPQIPSRIPRKPLLMSNPRSRNRRRLPSSSSHPKSGVPGAWIDPYSHISIPNPPPHQKKWNLPSPPVCGSPPHWTQGPRGTRP